MVFSSSFCSDMFQSPTLSFIPLHPKFFLSFTQIPSPFCFLYTSAPFFKYHSLLLSNHSFHAKFPSLTQFFFFFSYAFFFFLEGYFVLYTLSL
ncbi:hypothetical protein K450DRAFT_257281 [Umbelopsis ramanniana AG]|uniref:Uncharacterized protein n=1 Tax=Umbelopsis ramanniana AG TaxID=1314678 RepID=A0AAD5E442_UMBRA|nr:uncharacterized protein K450DRAFT_257281 [Umbelopsis ramanniana AG]KAI8576339.1 hypothetical protein K450DRAFT_257281 [Umbelopsis ramanniana AG]